MFLKIKETVRGGWEERDSEVRMRNEAAAAGRMPALRLKSRIQRSGDRMKAICSLTTAFCLLPTADCLL
jgi:hypothetical protein